MKNWDYQERCNTSCLNKERRNIYAEDTIPLDEMYERYIQCSETCYLDGFSMFLKQVENELNFYQVSGPLMYSILLIINYNIIVINL